MSDLGDDAKDAEYTRLLVGKWKGDELDKGIQWHYITIYNPDSTHSGFGAGLKNGSSMPFHSSGRWFVKHSRLHVWVEASPTLPAAEKQEFIYPIVSVDEKAFRWESTIGEVFTHHRVG
ncbi:uncharacterized protein SOCE26_050480 [Sorangium cellulosum]|uniref:Uncharacterized protein n=1 Tax=Sorangium cellulosum TaxID=56 RepID=A0A2L0EWB6_SORCE|nr:hypothetical protein [Sorangium cellulosum]AUX43598.1 uncharacterized protein SOCE26_050480 [Sorangium cellulosum]